jgi:hypothetical protein
MVEVPAGEVEDPEAAVGDGEGNRRNRSYTGTSRSRPGPAARRPSGSDALLTT